MYQNRVVYIEELNNFLSSTKDKFFNLLQTINWTKESLISSKEEPSHSSFIDHKTVYQNEFQQDGVPDIGQVNILDLLYGIHLQTGIELLLYTSCRFKLCLGLNSETGVSGQLYNEMVASLLAAELPIKIKNDVREDKVEDKAAALAQLLKMERDAKRRRISYKNKVHTKNKSHTEVMREVLKEQMLTLTVGQTNEMSINSSVAHTSMLKQPTELIAIKPSHGNPHLAWLSIIEDEEEMSKTNSHQTGSLTQHSEHNIYQKSSSDCKQRSKPERYKDRKDKQKDSSSKEWKREESGFSRHRDKEKKEEGGDNRHRDKEKKKSGWDEGRREHSPLIDDRRSEGRRREHSPRKEERHRKKKKRNHSHSSGTDPSEFKKHKSKHKKTKH